MQQPIQTLLNRLVSEGKERGLQVAAYVDGVLVVNAWAGVADFHTGLPVDESTLFPVFSTTKGMVATVIHLLAERGLLSYDTPVSKIWPKFGVNGKEQITVRQVLNHSSGIPQMPAGIGFEELCDWDLMCAKIAGQAPIWPPGTRMEYHAMTYGWILGEVARRTDGRTFARLLEDEICRPLGIQTMFAGIPDAVESRVAVLEEYELGTPPPDDGKPQSVPASLGPLHAWMNRPDVRRACVPASNGIMNALAIARHYAALLPGGVDGVELLPPARVRLATEMQKPDHPQGDDYPKNWGLGYAIGGNDSLYGDVSAFGHAGYGGSNGFADPQSGLAVGITKNLYHKEDTAGMILKELRRAFEAARR
ncbi:MAG: serine hydrolase domain-containing protein [Verrucomicrobiota bacterium]